MLRNMQFYVCVTKKLNLNVENVIENNVHNILFSQTINSVIDFEIKYSEFGLQQERTKKLT